MAEFIVLGLKASDKLIEKHFDKIPEKHFGKIPDAVINPLQSLKKIRHRNKGAQHPDLESFDSEESREWGGNASGDDYEEPIERQSSPRQGGRGRKDDYDYDSSDNEDYSDRRQDYSPADRYWQQDRERRIRDTAQRRSRYAGAGQSARGYYSSDQNRDPRYPNHERGPESSCSYSAPPSEPPLAYPYPYRGTSPPRRSRSTHRVRDSDRPALKTRPSSAGCGKGGGLGDAFSMTDRGLGVGGVGALAGGFVAQEVQKARGKRDPVLLTLLGAAVGGLGANILEGRYEKRKREREKEKDR